MTLSRGTRSGQSEPMWVHVKSGLELPIITIIIVVLLMPTTNLGAQGPEYQDMMGSRRGQLSFETQSKLIYIKANLRNV